MAVDFSTREGIMKEWGKWVAYHKAGGRGSWPTDAFESLLDWYDERLEEEKNANQNRMGD